MKKYCKICKCNSLALKVAQNIDFNDKLNTCMKCLENEKQKSQNWDIVFQDKT